MNKQQMINEAICNEGFSDKVLKLIDNYIIDIQNGTEDFYRYNLSEHAGLCTAGAPLIGAAIIASYATASLGAGGDADGGKRSRPANWEIDERQEKIVQQWAKAKQCWFPNAIRDIESEYGEMIAEGAEAIVYYKDGDTSVIKLRTSIYATLGRALESIVLHNALFPETPMNVIGFTRDKHGLFRTILTQPYICCKRLATKKEIDDMVAAKGFRDNYDGQGINYIGERLCLEDMHPANVFVDEVSNAPICIDCIVKFVRK